MNSINLIHDPVKLGIDAVQRGGRRRALKDERRETNGSGSKKSAERRPPHIDLGLLHTVSTLASVA